MRMRGGVFIAVDDNGTLHKTAFTEYRAKYTEHPDSKVVFENCKIPLVVDVLRSAKRLHMAIPEIGVVNWDFTLDVEGKPVLIEANIRCGSPWMSEMAHGRGPFGEDTAKILRWMRVMKGLKVNDRGNFSFGRNFE